MSKHWKGFGKPRFEISIREKVVDIKLVTAFSRNSSETLSTQNLTIFRNFLESLNRVLRRNLPVCHEF